MRCAIVLAAGRSTRMGAQKVLLPFGEGTAIERIVGELARSAIDRVLVVVGHEAERVEAALAVVRDATSVEGALAVGSSPGRERGSRTGPPVAVVRNPDPLGDMLSSVRCGLRALPEACDAILVALGDQPRIAAEVIDALLRAFDAGRVGVDAGERATGVRKGIVVPVHGGKRGHPVLIAASYRAEILERHEGVGLRGLLAAHPEDVLELEVPDDWVLSDMDRPEDYRRERRASVPPGR